MLSSASELAGRSTPSTWDLSSSRSPGVTGARVMVRLAISTSFPTRRGSMKPDSTRHPAAESFFTWRLCPFRWRAAAGSENPARRAPRPAAPGAARVVEVQHRGHRVDADAVDVVFAQPEQRIGDQEVAYLVAAGVENERAPIRM